MAENTSARNDNDDWIDTRSASQISAVVLSYIAGISLAGRAMALRHRRDNPWRSVIAEPNLERAWLFYTGVLFGCTAFNAAVGRANSNSQSLFARYGFIKAWRVAKIVSYCRSSENQLIGVTNSYNGAHI